MPVQAPSARRRTEPAGTTAKIAVTDRRRAGRIDAHQHFWDLSTGAYAWPTPEDDPIFRSFGPADLEPDLRAADVDATIVVQAIDTLEDTDAMIAAAGANPWIVGVVGWAPLLDVEGRGSRDRRPAGTRDLRHPPPDPP